MNKNNSNTLILIGNGYDLANGYKTSYSCFINSHFFTDLTGSLFNYISNVNEHKKWVDLEMELYNYSLRLTSDYGDRDTEAEEKAEEFKKEYSELKKALSLYINVVNSSLNATSEMAREIECLEHLFCNWIEENPDGYHIISFNYTRTIETMLYNRLNLSSVKLTQVHGFINFDDEDHIVLGIDEGMVVNPLHNFLYKSSSEHIRNENFRELVYNATKYIIFGTSFGKTDDWYYKQLFNNNQNRKIYELYYYGRNERDLIIGRIRQLTGCFNDFKTLNKLLMYDSSDLKNEIERRKKDNSRPDLIHVEGAQK